MSAFQCRRTFAAACRASVVPTQHMKRLFGRRGSLGFTLLEMLVTLAIVGLAGAIALPNLQSLYEAVARRTDRDAVLDQVSRLGAQARLAGQDLVIWPGEADALEQVDSLVGATLDAYVRHQFRMPPDWRLVLDRPLVVRANGVCLGAAMTLIDNSGRRAEYLLEAPFCRVR